MHLVVIGDRKTCLAFALAGIETREVSGPKDAAEAFSRAAANPETGMVLITRPLAESIRELVDRVIYRRHLPLVVEIPDSSGKPVKARQWREKILSML